MFAICAPTWSILLKNSICWIKIIFDCPATNVQFVSWWFWFCVRKILWKSSRPNRHGYSHICKMMTTHLKFLSFQSRLKLEGIFGCDDGKPALLSLRSPRPLPPIWQTNLHQLSQNILQICKLMLIRNNFPKNILQISELMSIRKTFSKTFSIRKGQNAK